FLSFSSLHDWKDWGGIWSMGFAFFFLLFPSMRVLILKLNFLVHILACIIIKKTKITQGWNGSGAGFFFFFFPLSFLFRSFFLYCTGVVFLACTTETSKHHYNKIAQQTKPE